MKTVNVEKWILIHAILLIFASSITVLVNSIIPLIIVCIIAFFFMVYLFR